MGKEMNDLIARLRAADEDTVAKALEGAYVQLPITDHAALLEAFNCVLDELLPPDGDVSIRRMRIGLVLKDEDKGQY